MKKRPSKSDSKRPKAVRFSRQYLRSSTSRRLRRTLRRVKMTVIAVESWVIASRLVVSELPARNGPLGMNAGHEILKRSLQLRSVPPRAATWYHLFTFTPKTRNRR